MRIEWVEGLDGAEASAALDRLEDDPAVASVLALAAAPRLEQARVLDDPLQGRSLPIVGGVFPGVVVERAHRSEALVLVGLPRRLRTAIVHDVGSGPPSRSALAGLQQAVAEGSGTVLAFVDAMSEGIEELLTAVFDEVGPFASYLGGGAGSLELASGPCILTNEGVLADAAVIGVLDAPSAVGVAHGWRPVGEPMQVTAGSGRTVVELDHEPAATVYLRAVEAHRGQALDLDRFPEIAPSYPLGIVRLDEEFVVRDPVAIDETSLVCIAEVPERAFVRLLHGDAQALLAAAERSAQDARAHASTQDEIGLVLDCISRALHLGERFDEELAVADPGVPWVGALSIGEISNPGDRFLELHNKTVLAARIQAGARIPT